MSSFDRHIARRPDGPTWTVALIETEKRSAKDFLDGLGGGAAPRQRLRAALAKVSELAEDPSSLAMLRRYIYALSALVQHMRAGGLSDQQVRGLSAMAGGILQVMGIKPASSKLGFLHGDLRLALSQIYRREGHHWRAAWEQQLVLHVAQRALPGGRGFQTLSSGIRALRMGDAAMALDSFDAAERLGLNDDHLVRSRLERIKALRLRGEYQACSDLADETRPLPGVTDRVALELGWERLCARPMDADVVGEILASTQRGKPHHLGVYILEAYLWSRAARSRRWSERYPTIRSIGRDRSLDLKGQGLFYQAVRGIELLFDEVVPFSVKIQSLGDLLTLGTKLVTIDKELLMWAAAARWLVGNRRLHLAAMALAEYQALSLRLTGGCSGDALTVVGDLLARPWFSSCNTTPAFAARSNGLLDVAS